MNRIIVFLIIVLTVCIGIMSSCYGEYEEVIDIDYSKLSKSENLAELFDKEDLWVYCDGRDSLIIEVDKPFKMIFTLYDLSKKEPKLRNKITAYDYRYYKYRDREHDTNDLLLYKGYVKDYGDKYFPIPVKIQENSIILYNFMPEYSIGTVELQPYNDVYPRWVMNHTMRKDFIDNKASFIFISEQDSIYLHIDKLINSSGNKWAYEHYKKDKGTVTLDFKHTIIKSFYFYTLLEPLTKKPLDNHLLWFESDPNKDLRVYFDYDAPKITFRDYPYKEDKTVLYRTTKEYYTHNPDSIKVEWIYTSAIDSLVLVLENSKMKEYVFQKGTSNILKYTDHGEYELIESKNGYKNIYIYNDNILRTSEKDYYYSQPTPHSLNLRLGGVSITYQRRKNESPILIDGLFN